MKTERPRVNTSRSCCPRPPLIAELTGRDESFFADSRLVTGRPAIPTLATELPA
jgi:hypothetical protein